MIRCGRPKRWDLSEIDKKKQTTETSSPPKKEVDDKLLKLIAERERLDAQLLQR
jgi:hypothetical protein